MKIVINENQMGLVFRNGKYIKMVGAGKYRAWGGKMIEVFDCGQMIDCRNCPLDILLEDGNFAAAVSVVDVNDRQLAFHFVNGSYAGVISEHGKYACFSGKDRHEFQLADISCPDVAMDFPRYLFDRMPSDLYIRAEVAEYQRGRLYFDNRFVRILEPGTHYFWKTNVRVDVGYVDTRLTQMDICGQEIMTLDKVTLRINFVCNYRVADYVKIVTEIDDYAEQMHVEAQLALRDYVGRYRLDEILGNKDEISRYVYDRLKGKEGELYVSVVNAGVKDIILPGEIREIMNTVLIAEKKAQANVIARREEVASTRSLLNTAKLMDENRTLYRLKELEYAERICENVGNITLNGSGDILSQLVGMLDGRKKKADAD